MKSTITNLRWLLPKDDSRFCSFDDSIKMFNHCLNLINEFLDSLDENSADQLNNYYLYLDNPSCSKDIPFDYINISADQVHTINNIIFYPPHLFINILVDRIKLKNILKKTVPKTVLEKIIVCSYKTERSQTELFKTNRELRWETIKFSPQGASKMLCWQIEIKLMRQIGHMKNFPNPKEVKSEFPELELGITVCPVTLEKLDYDSLVEEGNNTIHGESGMQLGYLMPKSQSSSAHNKDNVSWISKDGNRIQGNNSIEDTHARILTISQRIKKAA